MREFEEKINAILSSPEAMGQIVTLANSIAGGSPPPAVPPPAGEGGPEGAASAPLSGEVLPAGAAGQSPLGGLDPALAAQLLLLAQEYGRGDDPKAALLSALKPFLRDERQHRLDRAVQAARLSRVVRRAAELLRRGDADV